MRKLGIGIVGFCLAALAAVGLYGAFFADKEGAFSREENRMLASFPSFTVETVLSGDFGQQLEGFLQDHFPFRNRVISFSQRLLDGVSLASYEEYAAISEEAPEDMAVLAAMAALEDEEAWTPAPATPQPRATPSPAVTPMNDTELPEMAPVPVTPNPYKAAAVGFTGEAHSAVTIRTEGKDRTLVAFSKADVEKGAAIFRRYADALPEDGHLLFAFVPSTYKMRKYSSAKNREGVRSDIELRLNSLTSEKVIAVPAAELLGNAIDKEEYVYFRSDWHPTPLGSHKVVSLMAEQVDIALPPYESYRSTVEESFLGTIYRDHPSNTLKSNADTLAKLTSPYGTTFTRYLSETRSKELPVINEKAPANDRYRVYLGGAGGPWSTLRGNPEAEAACLVLSDSYGLVPTVLLTAVYNHVHYCDPRYFSASDMGGRIRDMLTRYGIRDIYILINEEHAFDSDFFTLIDRQLGKAPAVGE